MDTPPFPRSKVQTSSMLAFQPNKEGVKAKDPATVVIFGASGDLSRRKLIPALYYLYEDGFLPKRLSIVGFSRTPMTDEAFREIMINSLSEVVKDPGELAQHPLVQSLHYVAGNSTNLDSYKELQQRLTELEEQYQIPGNRLYYLSVAPKLFTPIIQHLSQAKMLYDKTDESKWSRVIIEKPFGTDLESAQALNRDITAILDESQIYRIDHYLGKETVQNILTFRFGNAIFEPLFNHKYIDHIQITVSESLGMEGKRGHYYDQAGALRDMVQNHIMQLLCLIAMEPPSGIEANAIRDEKVKVLRSLVPMTPQEVAANTVRAQYTSGIHNAEAITGYLEEEGVDPLSKTETYVAMKLGIDNWRWAGVPFLIRTGKRLHKRVSEIAVFFKQPPLQFFRQDSHPDLCLLQERPKANRLIFRIQPVEGISLSFASKRPGMQIDLEEVKMDFFYRDAFQERSPEAYERLLLDALRGDASLFTRSDEVEYAWRFISSIHQGWNENPTIPVAQYRPFSEGPEEAKELAPLNVRWQRIQNM